MMGRAAALLVRLYQLSLGRLLPQRCRFHPSCSRYARTALVENGLFFGGLQATWRLLRCAPWSAGGIDEVRRIGAGPGAGPLRRMVRARLRGPAREPRPAEHVPVTARAGGEGGRR